MTFPRPLDFVPTQDGGASAVQIQSPPGMTLRDYLAAHAPEQPAWWTAQRPKTGRTGLEHDAAWRYAWADAMLAERARGSE